MEEKYFLNEKSIIINFSESFCKTESEVLSSDAFARVWEGYLKHLNRTKNETLIGLVKIARNPVKSFINLFKVLLSFSIKEVMEMSDAYKKILIQHENLYLLVENFYDYWRHLERYGLMNSEANRHSIESQSFIEANEEFNALILKVYRNISQKVQGTNFHIYRQLAAGINASLLICSNPWASNYPVYNNLNKIPFIDSVLIKPTFISYSRRNTRTGLYYEVSENELKDLTFNPDEWFCYPAHVGASLAYVYFHRDYMSHGIALSNLFEFVHMDEIKNKKPDLIYIFGAPVEGKSRYYYDEENDIYICPNNKDLIPCGKINKDGYQAYKADPCDCSNCPFKESCTKGKYKQVLRHVWAEYKDMVKESRHRLDVQEIYRQRPQHIERVFADGKTKFGLTKTYFRGIEKVHRELTLLYACMNLKKFALHHS